MTPFSSLVAEFAEKTGVTPGNPGADNFDIVTDGIQVSVQYRQDKDDCIIFTLPLGDMEPDPTLLAARPFGLSGGPEAYGLRRPEAPDVGCTPQDEANAVMEKYAEVVRAQIAP